METVTVRRTLDAPPDAIRDALWDLEPFMAAAGFDEVETNDDRIRVANTVGIVTIELELEVVGRTGDGLAYEQVDGIFREMRTEYEVAGVPDGTEVTARTEFALDVAVVGEALDATVIRRQRRKELRAQLDWLEDVTSD